MKLTITQKELLVLMQTKSLYYNSVTSGASYTIGGYGSSGKTVRKNIVEALEKEGLISKGRVNPAIYIYQLSDRAKELIQETEKKIRNGNKDRSNCC